MLMSLKLRKKMDSTTKKLIRNPAKLTNRRAVSFLGSPRKKSRKQKKEAHTILPVLLSPSQSGRSTPQDKRVNGVKSLN